MVGDEDTLSRWRRKWAKLLSLILSIQARASSHLSLRNSSWTSRRGNLGVGWDVGLGCLVAPGGQVGLLLQEDQQGVHHLPPPPHTLSLTQAAGSGLNWFQKKKIDLLKCGLKN